MAAGLDFDSRGGRLDEALDVCVRLWRDDVVEHHGRFFDFGPVMFEPKPIQRPHPPVLIGGESPAALRRAAAHDGWIGLNHTPDSVSVPIAALAEHRARMGRDNGAFTVTVGGSVEDDEDVERFASAGVDRLIVSPWRRTREVADGLATFARRFLTG